MVERLPLSQSGYLGFHASGGVTSREMRDFLSAVEDSYQAIARVELEAQQSRADLELWLRYGPPPRLGARGAWGGAFPLSADALPAEPLVVHRVVLESPGFWEFFGALNPLEVLRRFLNDRHERRKDREYREEAEWRRLGIENALGELEVVRRAAELEREFGSGAFPEEARRRLWAAEVREPLERLAEFERRGLIDGGSAKSDPESLRLDRPSGPENG